MMRVKIYLKDYNLTSIFEINSIRKYYSTFIYNIFIFKFSFIKKIQKMNYFHILQFFLVG
jgi:hypothetical protein